MGPPHGAQSDQDRSKTGGSLMVLDRFFSPLDFRFDFDRFRVHFIFVPFWGAKWSPWGGTELGVPPLPWGPKPVLWSSWCGSWFVLRSGIVLEPSSALLGTIFGRSWCHFRPSRDPFSVCGCRLGTFYRSMFTAHLWVCDFQLSKLTSLLLHP